MIRRMLFIEGKLYYYTSNIVAWSESFGHHLVAVLTDDEHQVYLVRHYVSDKGWDDEEEIDEICKVNFDGSEEVVAHISSKVYYTCIHGPEQRKEMEAMQNG